jgi:hypothetical protein
MEQTPWEEMFDDLYSWAAEQIPPTPQTPKPTISPLKEQEFQMTFDDFSLLKPESNVHYLLRREEKVFPNYYRTLVSPSLLNGSLENDIASSPVVFMGFIGLYFGISFNEAFINRFMNILNKNTKWRSRLKRNISILLDQFKKKYVKETPGSFLLSTHVITFKMCCFELMVIFYNFICLESTEYGMSLDTLTHILKFELYLFDYDEKDIQRMMVSNWSEMLN